MIAVDVGNARIKLGWFHDGDAATLPQPEQTLRLAGRAVDFTALAAWLGPLGSAAPMAWYIGSVNRPAATRLIDWLRQRRPQDRLLLLSAGDLPLEVKLARPDMVGIDRLLDALAANQLRPAGRPAIVIDVGTAITVDMVSAAGAFLGGAILPGIAMSARALHEFTDLLPLVDVSELAAPPPALGVSTVSAMRAGLFWGTVGALRQLIDQLADDAQPQVILTGDRKSVV